MNAIHTTVSPSQQSTHFTVHKAMETELPRALMVNIRHLCLTVMSDSRGTGWSHTWRRRPRRPLHELRAPGTPRLWRSYGQKSSGIGIQVQCSQGEEMLKPWFPWAGAGLLSPIILLTAHTHTSPPPVYLKYQQIFFHKFRYQGYKFGFASDTCLAAPCAPPCRPLPLTSFSWPP